MTLNISHVDFAAMIYPTQQMRVLGAVFEQVQRPLTPAEICERARKEIPAIGIATVNRAIKQFLDEGKSAPSKCPVPGAAPTTKAPPARAS